MMLSTGMARERAVGFGGHGADVRGQHDVGQVEERVVLGRQRLLGVDVQAGAGDAARAERGGQRRLIDQRAARGVDQDRPLGFISASSRAPTRPRTSGVLRRWTETTSALPKDVVAFDQLDAQPRRPRRIAREAPGDDAHAQAAAQPRHVTRRWRPGRARPASCPPAPAPRRAATSPAAAARR